MNRPQNITILPQVNPDMTPTLNPKDLFASMRVVAAVADKRHCFPILTHHHYRPGLSWHPPVSLRHG